MMRKASAGYALVQKRHKRVVHRKRKSLGGSGVTIQAAIKRPGALTAKAQAAGQSVQQYAAAHAGDKGRAGAESRFYTNVLKPANRRRAA